MDLKEIEHEVADGDWPVSELAPMAGFYEHGNEPSSFVKRRGIP
jgi:hypothetical protein